MPNLNQLEKKTMSEFMFNKIKKELTPLGISISYESDTSHECVVKHNQNTIAYISRKVGITKGYLSVVIAPELINTLDVQLRPIDGITVKLNSRTKGRYVSSSNYSGFENKQTQRFLDTNEHVGCAYKLDVSSTFLCIGQFFAVLINTSTI
ncbi:MAG: hypothetical protein ACI9O6_000904 [Glaciecola sp.]|jgi:hypothetical protein